MLLRMRAHFLMKWTHDRMLTASITLATTMVGSKAVLKYVRGGIYLHSFVHSLFTSVQIQIEFSMLAGCI
jgi:hypothetical protein